MSRIRSVCVYCGSGPGNDPAYVEAAEQFGRELAKNDVRLVYGGGKVGIMGAVSRAVIDHGGQVTGIIPEFLMEREHARKAGNGLIVTHDMHQRKRKMFQMADAFVALPGGVGTLEEIVEQITWAQLGRHRKPILLANINKFWDPLCALFEHMKSLQFIRRGLEFDLLLADKADDILPKLQAAAAAIPEEAKQMQTADTERL
jgi:uncharacterized protein (TIGR00730 family)